MTTILLVDDDPFNRQGLALYLAQAGYDVLQASDAGAAWSTVTTHEVDALILDIVIPSDSHSTARSSQDVGMQLAKRVKDAYPSLGIVIFSAYEDRGAAAWDMLHDGVRGLAYKLKGCSPASFLEALRNVMAGGVVIDPEVTSSAAVAEELVARLSSRERPWVEGVLRSVADLSPREREIAQRIAAAQSGKAIARELHLAPKTVEHNITRIYAKLGLSELPSRDPELRQAVILAKAFMIYDLQRDLT